MTSLAPEFLHDVFISYSHGDSEKTGDALLKNWSEAFYKRLRSELHTLPGWDDADIFIDDGSLDRADPLMSQLRSSIARSALLLILMSPHYLRSKACKTERQLWFEKIATESFPEVRSRVLMARIWPLLRTDTWPTEFCDELGQPPLGTWFHRQPGDAVKTRPFGWTAETDPEFRSQLVELAGDIAVRLDELKQSISRKRNSASNIEKLRPPGGQPLYVHARKGAASWWEEICTDLVDAGYGVVPDGPESFPANIQQLPDLESENLQTLTSCDGLLLVPGENPAHLASDLVIVGHRRRNSARATSNKPLPCAVVDHHQIGVAKPLLKNSAKNMQIHWIDASSSGWTKSVKEWLNMAADLAGGTA
jgi:TIR domain